MVIASSPTRATKPLMTDTVSADADPVGDYAGSRCRPAMSAFGGKADVPFDRRNVRF
jgi:hypothetical protein